MPPGATVRWARTLVLLASALIALRTAQRATELAAGYGSVGSILCHPLHLCAHFAKEGPLALLLDASAALGPWSPIAVDGTNAFGATALHTAALRGSDWAAELLLSAGADPGRRTSEGLTALMVARSAYDAELVRSGPRRVAAYLINRGGCDAEPCLPCDVQALREWEVVATKGGDIKLPGGPQLPLQARVALYAELWEQAQGDCPLDPDGVCRSPTAPPAEPSPPTGCEICSWLADLQAMAAQLQAKEARRAGRREEAQRAREEALEWLRRSVGYSPSYRHWTARQAELLAAADGDGALDLGDR